MAVSSSTMMAVMRAGGQCVMMEKFDAELALQAFGGLLQRSYPGVLDVDFGLRYEAADRSLRATAVRLNVLRIDGLPPRAAAVLQGLGAALAGQALGEVVLHHLRDKDLALDRDRTERLTYALGKELEIPVVSGSDTHQAVLALPNFVRQLLPSINDPALP